MPDRPLRILHFTAADDDGPGRASQRLQAGLRALGHESSVLVREKRGNGQNVEAPVIELEGAARQSALLYEVFQRWYIHHNRTPLSNSRFTLNEPGWPLEDHPLVRKADLLHFHSVAGFLSPTAMAKLAGLGKPVVWTLHDQRPFTGGCHFSAGCSKFTEDCGGCPQLGWDPYFLTEAQLSDASEQVPLRNIAFVAPTRWMAKLAKASALLKHSLIEVIPGGVEPSRFPVRWKPQAKGHLGLEPETTYLLFVASNMNETRKGFAHLTRVIHSCLTQPSFKKRAENGGVALICLGHTQQDLSGLGIPAVCLGHVSSDEELSQLYGAADLLLLPSEEENAPNTVLEAMSSGTPVVAFDVGGLRDLVEEGRTGRLVPVGNTQLFAEAVTALLAEEPARQQMGALGRERVIEQFSFEVQASAHVNLYEELLRSRRTASARTSPPSASSAAFTIRQAAPAGPRLQQVCAKSLPEPLQQFVIACEDKWQAHDRAQQAAEATIQRQQEVIKNLEAELDQQRGVVREHETTIFRQKEILGSGAIRMLRNLKLIKK